MRESNRSELRSRRILRTQSRLITAYIISLAFLSVAIMLMPTEVLIWNFRSASIYGHSILFWLSLFSAAFCFSRFKKENTYFKKTFPAKLPQKAFTLYRSRESKGLYIATASACFLLLILFCFPFGALPRFILFAICMFLLGLYLGVNSYEYCIYHKHTMLAYRLSPKSQTRRDENDENF